MSLLATMPALTGSAFGLLIFAGLAGVVLGLFWIINKMPP